jgi:hypothetical protein
MDSVQTPERLPVPDSAASKRVVAGPVGAAAFAAGITYAWLEALWRLLFTYYPNFDANWVLWNGRVGDIAAMWLTISGIALVVGVGLYLLWRGRSRVGTVADWTVVLVGSAVAAPMIGEIGNTTGSVAGGAGSTDMVAIIAYSILGVVVVGVGLTLAVLHGRA